MDGFVILARFRVVPGARDEFLDRVRRNAAASVADEPGCRRFDVLTDEAGATDVVVLYEIYDSAAAFDAHMRTPHFAAFRSETSAMVLSADVERFLLSEHARPG
jgi:quinol monooxygenase YgiN